MSCFTLEKMLGEGSAKGRLGVKKEMPRSAGGERGRGLQGRKEERVSKQRCEKHGLAGSQAAVPGEAESIMVPLGLRRAEAGGNVLTVASQGPDICGEGRWGRGAGWGHGSRWGTKTTRETAATRAVGMTLAEGPRPEKRPGTKGTESRRRGRTPRGRAPAVLVPSRQPAWAGARSRVVLGLLLGQLCGEPSRLLSAGVWGSRERPLGQS